MPHNKKVILLACLFVTAAAANQRYSNYCMVGNKTVVTTGVSGAPKVQASYPQCQVTVYQTGTVTKATIYSDNATTPLANPFTAQTTGYFYFYATNGRYDVTLSGGGLPAPVTLGDVLLADPFAGGGASGFILNPADYNFTPQSPGNALVIGSNTIALAPCPLGVAGSNTSYRMYISGGVGAAESVPVTGGTCTSGASTGNVIVTAANTHAGAWTISSVAGGLPEAINAATAGSVIGIKTTITATGTTTINKALLLFCGTGSGLTGSGLGSGNLITIGASTVKLTGCTLNGGSTTGNAVQISAGLSGITVDNNTMTSAANGVSVNTGDHIAIRENTVSGMTNVGIFAGFAGPTYADISSNAVSSVGCTTLNCGAISLWGTGGSHSTIMGNRVVIGGNQDGGVFAGSTTVASDIAVVGNTVKIAGSNTFECGNVGRINGFTFIGNTCDATGQSGSMPIGWELGESSNGVVWGNQVFGNLLTGMIGILAESISEVQVGGNTIKGYGGIGIFLQHTNSAYPTRNNNIIGNTLIQTSTSTIAVDLKLDTVTTGSVIDNVFADNVIVGYTNANHTCLTIANSGSATVDRTVVRGNRVNSCDTGISVAGTNTTVNDNVINNVATGISIGGGVTGASLSGNKISASTRAYDLSSTVFVFDLTSAMTAAFIPGNLVDGSMLYVSNATITNPCGGGGTGAILKRLNGVNVCN